MRVWLKRAGDHCISGTAACTWGDYTEGVPEAKPLGWQFTNLLRSIFWRPVSDPDTLDLIVPQQGHKVDNLTRWGANEFIPFWHSLKQSLRYKKVKTPSEENGLPVSEGKTNFSLKKSNPSGIFRIWLPQRNISSDTVEEKATSANRTGLTVYSEARILQFTSAVATAIACLLPTLAIAVLSNLQSTRELLGVIAAFTATFAIGLMFLTDASTSRVEIFTATVA